ncbi:MAG TPA: response regulator [Tepidisphaeraceae bacterium]|jgi:ActR/RegA family two-component response regulator|nr:response regulator [Tepidisphaeraceae bacterium]
MAIRILDIGQCGFDGPRMAALWHKAIGATVDRCASGADALACATQNHYDIILVNRILDADNSSGLDVIASLIQSGVSTPIMLVSDLPEAQDAAVKLGATRGFGKAALGDPATIDLVARVAAAEQN